MKFQLIHQSNFIVKSLLYSFCLFFSTTSLADPGWRGIDTIEEILMYYHNEGVSIRFKTSVPLNSCSVGDEVLINRTLQGYKEIYATLLAAYLSQKNIDVWVDGTCQNLRNVGIAIRTKN